MNNDFYHREQEQKSQHQRHDTVASKHQTMETWQLEQDEAHQHIGSPRHDAAEAKPGLLARIRKLFGG